MPALETPNRQAANLYWLAFLLTGDRQAGIDATVEAIGSAEEDNSFFLGWMMVWSRKVVIAKALAAIRQELALSARRIASLRCPKFAPLPHHWTLAPGATRLELERALLAIDAFPRCVLLLLLFEGLSLDDATVLLDADYELVRKAEALALGELTRNLAAPEVAHA